MALNEKIISKVKEKTNDDPFMQRYLLGLLIFETEQRGHYKQDYIKILNRMLKESEE